MTESDATHEKRTRVGRPKPRPSRVHFHAVSGIASRCITMQFDNMHDIFCVRKCFFQTVSCGKQAGFSISINVRENRNDVLTHRDEDQQTHEKHIRMGQPRVPVGKKT